MNSCCEFSKKIFINQIQKKEFRITIEADKSERKALAERFSIPEILSLSCFYKLAYFHGGHIRAQGILKSSIIQNCVVSLEDFPVDIEDGFELILYLCLKFQMNWRSWMIQISFLMIMTILTLER